MVRYHEWMKDPYLQEMTASEPLTLDEEYAMQKSWLEDEDSKVHLFVITDISHSWAICLQSSAFRRVYIHRPGQKDPRRQRG